MDKLTFRIFLITVFFNIWLPKGGVKVSGVPITIGNILFLVLTVVFIFRFIIIGKIKLDNTSIFLILASMYFLTRLMIAIVNIINNDNILNEDVTLSYTIGFLVPLVIYPIIYLIGYNLITDENRVKSVIKVIVAGFIFLAVYSLLQYLFGINNVTIPGITANYSDVKESTYWYLQKSNRVGDFTKFFSTYQNGNLFGINLLILFPIVFESVICKSKKKAYILLVVFMVIGFATLSRSCWLGIAIYFIVRFVFDRIRNKKEFFIKLFIVISVLIVTVVLFMNIPQLGARLFQSDFEDLSRMSGRTPNAVMLFEYVFKNNNSIAFLFGPYGLFNYSGSAYEMTYFAIFMVGGAIGLIFWVMPFVYILFYRLYRNKTYYIAKGAYLSLIVWAVVAFIEGAYWLPPTAFNIWLIIVLGSKAIDVHNNPHNIMYRVLME